MNDPGSWDDFYLTELFDSSLDLSLADFSRSSLLSLLSSLQSELLQQFVNLIRSSLVGRRIQLRDEPWKARASEPKGSVQAPGRWNNRPWSGSGGADKSQTFCSRLQGLVPWFREPMLSSYL
jgi:hypothetical protein